MTYMFTNRGLVKSIMTYPYHGILCSYKKQKSLFLKIYLFLIFGCVGLCCCVPASSSCSEQGLLFIAVRGLLIAVASPVVKHRL